MGGVGPRMSWSKPVIWGEITVSPRRVSRPAILDRAASIVCIIWWHESKFKLVRDCLMLLRSGWVSSMGWEYRFVAGMVVLDSRSRMRMVRGQGSSWGDCSRWGVYLLWSPLNAQRIVAAAGLRFASRKRVTPSSAEFGFLSRIEEVSSQPERFKEDLRNIRSRQ